VDNPQEQTEKVSEEDAAEAEDLGTQEIDGVECRGWRISNYGEENAAAKMWLHKEYGLPIKIEVFENDELIRTVEYKNLTVGDIPADTFEIPEDVEILDMSG